MKAVVISRPGGPEVLEIRERPAPAPGPEEVAVRVRASGLNRADVLQRRGRYPAPPGVPEDVPGLEFAGEVAERGERARDLPRGARVMGILAGGGHAERVVVHERQCLAVPAALGWDEAAAVPEAFLTAFDALFGRAGLRAGETVVVEAAGSGVGTAAVQLAVAAGAHVVALSRTKEKRERLARLGALASADPADPGVAERVLEASGGRGADVVLDFVGAAAVARHLEWLADGGRVVVLGLLGGATGEIDLAALMRRRACIIGSVLRSRPLEEKVALTREFARVALPLFDTGRLRPIVHARFPMHEAAAAHALLESNTTFGKVVLTFP